MKKIKTLYKKDPSDLSRVTNEVDPSNQWVLDCGSLVIPTRKYDGTACAIIDWQLYKRYDVKKGKKVPDWAIPCQDPDPITWHRPHRVKCDRSNPEDKRHYEWYDNLEDKKDWTYELCGERIQWNPEKIEWHKLIKHGMTILDVSDFSFEWLKKYLSENDIEWIVFYLASDGRMCKIRKKDFGIVR